MNESAGERDPLEQLADEFAARCRKGESPSIAEYAARYPCFASRIQDLFPAVALMERLRSDEKAKRKTAAVRDRFARAPEQLGDFVILREIGRGGMGLVYEAEQKSLARRVAVKVLPKHVLLLGKHLRRFQREAQTAARLRHTNIVPVFGVGEQEGLHYYVMPLIRGVGLEEVIRALRAGGGSRPAGATVYGTPADCELGAVLRELIAVKFPDLPRAQAAADNAAGQAADRRIWPDNHPRRLPADHGRWVAQVGVQIADALQYAHAQGTLHRDIKPSNLLIDEDGVVCVADFGLARAVDRSELSQSSEVAGTLRYMAPEQLRGAADARSDVYAVGLTLYELLTLRPVFEGADRGRCPDGQVRSDPVPPRKINRAVPRDLETIVLKCLAWEPSRRYATADALAADLRCFLQDQPIRARRASWTERGRRWCRRNPALAAVSVVAALLLFAVAATLVGSGMRTRAAYAEATRALTQVEATSRLTREVLDGIYVQLSPDRVRIPADSDRDGAGVELPLERRRLPVETSREVAAVLENLLVFYDRLAEQVPRDGRVLLDSAIASRRVGDIRQRLGQLDQAEWEYVRALAKFSACPSVTPSDLTVPTELARTYNEIGNVRSAKFQFGGAHESHRRALWVLRTVEPATGLAESYRYELARTLYFLAGKHLGAMDGRRGGEVSETVTGAGPHYYKSHEYRTAAISLLEALIREHPNTPDYRFLLALCYRLSGVGPPAERLATRASGRQRALEILEQLQARYPDVTDYRYELAVTCAALPVGLFSWEDRAEIPADAEASLLRALDELQWLVTQHPTVPAYARCRALTLAKMGMVCWRSGRRAEAAGWLQEAFQTQSKMIAASPSLPPHNRVLLELVRLRWTQIRREHCAAANDRSGLSSVGESLETCIAQVTELTERPELAQDGLALSALPAAYETLSLVRAELGEAERAGEAARVGQSLRSQLHAGRQAGWRQEFAASLGL